MSKNKIISLFFVFKNILNNLYFKLFLTLLFLLVVFFKIDLNFVISILNNSDLFLLFLSIILFFINSFISVWRLKLSFSFFNKEINYSNLLKIHFIGLFYNFFLPAPIGGDMSKTLYFPKKIRKKIAFSVIFFDRIIGLITLLIITMFSLLYNQELILSFRKISFYWIFLFLIFFLIAVFIGIRSFKKQVLGILEKIKRLKLIKLTYPFVVSMILQISLVYFNYLIAQSLSFGLTYMQHALVYGLVTFVTVLPITISGYGLREVSSIALYSLFGINSEQTLAKVLIMYLIYFLGVILGWIYIIFNRNKRKKNVNL